jgi:tetratricopeptide (TPR) repeat protein
LASSAASGWQAAWPAARAAGWSRAELLWEHLQDRANHSLSAGDRANAVRGFRRAWWLARLAFSREDPCYATSLANMAAADRLMGAEARARRRYEKALQLWAKVPAQADAVEIAPRARSSLFHLRMEARHRQTYEATRRLRLAAFASEAAETLSALACGSQPPHRHHGRWAGERPPVFDGSRRLLSACLLIAVPEI